MEETITLQAKAILFDMDGTLVDSTAVIDRAWRWWSARHAVPLEPILAVQQGRPNREVLKEFAPGHLDLDQEAALFLKFEEEDLDGVIAVPGALEAVKAAQGGKWGIVTSANRSLAEIRLKATGFPIPQAFITADVIRQGKPHPECYLLGAAALEVDPHDCIVFEDAPAGAKAGKAAGATVIGVLTTLSKQDLPADYHIPDFRSIQIHLTPTKDFLIQLPRP